jgi:hypothetical protein
MQVTTEGQSMRECPVGNAGCEDDSRFGAVTRGMQGRGFGLDRPASENGTVQCGTLEPVVDGVAIRIERARVDKYISQNTNVRRKHIKGACMS